MSPPSRFRRLQKPKKNKTPTKTQRKPTQALACFVRSPAKLRQTVCSRQCPHAGKPGKPKRSLDIRSLTCKIVDMYRFDVAFDAVLSESTTANNRLCRGIAKLVKALDFDSSIPRFESLFPCH